MARDGLFFESIARVHPRFGTPHRATMIQAFLAVVLIVAGSFQQIISYFFFVTVVFIGMTVAGLFIIRRRPFAGYTNAAIPFDADRISGDNVAGPFAFAA